MRDVDSATTPPEWVALQERVSFGVYRALAPWATGYAGAVTTRARYVFRLLAPNVKWNAAGAIAPNALYFVGKAAYVGAVRLPARRAVVAGGNDDIPRVSNDCAHLKPWASATPRHRGGNGHKRFRPVWPS